MSLIEKIKQGEGWDFHGGIHPPENKLQTSTIDILPTCIPNELVLPLRQHIGTAGRILVSLGDEVKKGQALTATDSHHACPIHAPTSGKIIDIKPHVICHPSGLSEPCIVLQPDFKDSWGEKICLSNYAQHSAETLIEHLRQMGIAGLGGAGFPSARKIQSGLGRIEILVINGVECEPYITADDRLMQEYAQEIIQGIEILQHILEPKLIVIAIEDNKRDAIAAMQKAAINNPSILVKCIPTKYPSGGEKQLIQILTGKQIPSESIPADIGILMQNVATVFAIKRAVLDGEPLIQRVVTLVGNTLETQANRWVLLGTKLAFLLEKHGHRKDEKLNRLIIGGPMMGFSAPSFDIPVSKTTNCLLLPSVVELPKRQEEISCIRCSSCAEACPASLLPQQLYWYAKQEDHEKCQQYHLFDCIECGVCAYVCPSDIPLVQYYRQTKANIRYQQAEQQASELAKQRFEAKKMRLEREKQQRESRHKEAAIERTRSMAQSESQDAVAAAIARVKAKQAQANNNLDALSLDEKQKLREARKQEAREHKQNNAQEAPDIETDKKSAVSAAIARAKARKAAQEQTQAKIMPAEKINTSKADTKKAAVAAAVARAKARKAQEQQATEKPLEPETAQTLEDTKKAAVAAAVARAKARKAQQQEATEKPFEPETAQTLEDTKKAAVAAAVARAKERKAQELQAKQAETSTQVQEQARQAVVAAAIERVKARKALQEKSQAKEAESQHGPQEDQEKHNQKDK